MTKKIKTISVFLFLLGTAFGMLAFWQLIGINEGVTSSNDPEEQKEVESVEEEIIENKEEEVEKYSPELSHERQIIETVQRAKKGAVSIKAREVSVGGSGFFVSEDGYIITNRHVVSGDLDYYVITSDGEEIDAEVIDRDPIRDLAFLKVEGDGFTVNELGDSDKIMLGQTAIAIGYTLGEFENSVSVGVVSGLGRDIWARDGRHVEFLRGVIQTDAAINLGNSGGPLLNLKGEVIGVNTAKDIGADNVGFAIPINQAKIAINSIIRSGKLEYPYLGIRYLTIDDEKKEEHDLPVNEGVLIISGTFGEPGIDPGTPAEEAGLKEGDIITSFGGTRLDSENPLYDVILNHLPGEEVEIEFLRDNEKHTVTVTLTKRED